MTTDELRLALDLLAELHAQQDALRLRREEIRDQIVPQEIKRQLDDLAAEFEPLEAAVNQQVADLEADIRRQVIEQGCTVKGVHVMAVYSAGRVSWDTKKLDGLMIAMPQLETARKVGEPSVSIRRL